MTSVPRRKRRHNLWLAQGGLCHYCKQPTREVHQDGGTLPDDAATIEHLRDRFDPERGQHDNEEHTVMACHKCNYARGVQRFQQHYHVSSKYSLRRLFNMELTVVPAFGRNYKTEEEVKQAWADERDFRICDKGSPWSGAYINRQQTKVGDKITVKFNMLQESIVIDGGVPEIK